MATQSETIGHKNLVDGSETDLHFHPGGGGPAFPVGAIFLSVDSTNPATTLGYGTWVVFGSGRILVGVDSGDPDFDMAEKTSGSKTASYNHDIVVSNLRTGGGITVGDLDHDGMSIVQPSIAIYMFKRTA